MKIKNIKTRRIGKSKYSVSKKITKKLFYILQFIDGVKFMAISISNLANNLSEGLHRTKCKLRHD